MCAAKPSVGTVHPSRHILAPLYATDLPVDLWTQILLLAFKGERKEGKSVLLKTVRQCSNAARQACNYCTTGLRLKNTHIILESKQLKTMTHLVAVTVTMDCLRTLCRDLNVLAGIFPNLSSLTLTHAMDSCCPTTQITQIGKILGPWRHSLLALQINACDIVYSASSSSCGDRCFRFGDWCFTTNDDWMRGKWCPDLPWVRSITLNDCTIDKFNLMLCPRLRTLDMNQVDLPSGIQLNGPTALRHITCTRTRATLKLDLRGCSYLRVLECDCADLLPPPGLKVLRENGPNGRSRFRTVLQVRR